MKNNINILLILLSFGFIACNTNVKHKNEHVETQETIPQEMEAEEVIEPEPNNEAIVQKDLKSEFRPNETLEIGIIYTDTIQFTNYNDDYDYKMLLGKKNGVEVGAIYNWDWQENDQYRFNHGDRILVKWKMERIIHAGDEEFIDYGERAIEAERIQSKNKAITFLWREDQYDEEAKQNMNTIVINETFSYAISDEEKAALGYVATFIGNECFWNAKDADNTSNLKCKILTALDLGYQCSDKHLGFLRTWFSKDIAALKKLETCKMMPYTATVQTTFDEITIIKDQANKTIKVSYKALGMNMRASKTWSWTQTDTFEYTSKNISLVNSEKSERVEKTVNNNPDNPDNPDTQQQDSSTKNANSFVISCGSGCAMTYSEHKIISKDTTTEVVFKVAMYINDVQDDEYFETYIFSCDASNNITQITLKGDDDYNIEDQTPAVQENLKTYANKLCKSTN